MAKKFSVPRGTADILPLDIPAWQDIESKARRILNTYNYKEVRTPFFEDIGLFERSLGQTSDVVNKQLLRLASDKKEGYALRPEGTASIVRSYVENSIDRKEALTKFFYMGPMFRGERPQKGRLRQFHQIGVEVLGPAAYHPYVDTEIIALNTYLLKSFGLLKFELKINTLGTPKDKANFSKFLRKQLKSQQSKLCEDCQNRFERNVFRILDCKNKACRSIRQSLTIDHSYLAEESRAYFKQVTQALDSLGVKYKISYDLVRGLDYYTHTVFEITGSSLGSQDALSAGGRYNHLVNQLGGTDVPAMGFALGVERVLLSIPQENLPQESGINVYAIALDEQYLGKVFKIVQILRAAGISAEMNVQGGSVKSQMRSANKSGAQAVILLGEEEENKEVVTVKNMVTGDQKEIAVNDLIAEIEPVIER